MPEIANERDLRLQATVPRLVPVALPDNVVVPSVKQVRLSASSLVFRIGSTGVPTPSTIYLTASLVALAGNIAWTCTGGTLKGQGFQRSLDYADMTADTATVQAAIIENGVRYFALLSIVRVRDGQDGTNGEDGTNGKRGTVQVARAISGATWSNSEANAAIAELGYGVPISRDTVTLYNNTTTPQYTETRFYAMGEWNEMAAYFNGGLLVDGTVAAHKLEVDSLDAISARIGTLRTASAGARLELRDNLIKCYDANGVLRVKIGDLDLP
jgi:hypothetical protein